jgi:hypothetical protein
VPQTGQIGRWRDPSHARVPISMAPSITAKSCARAAPRNRERPALMKLSIIRRFTASRSTRSQKSYREVKCRPLERAATIDSTALAPTFLDRAQAKAKRFAARREVSSEEFTSGGSTAIPISRHSLMYRTTFAVFPDSTSAART